MFHNPQKIMGEYVKEGSTVVDAGCGPGFFSVALAEMVGESGRVLSVDLQQEMLDQLRVNAERLNLQGRISMQQCMEDRLGITEKVDFALAFYMVHEVPDVSNFFVRLCSCSNPTGCL